MKLALATLSIVRIGTGDRTGPRRGRSGSNILLRSNSIHPIKAWRPSGGLVARWDVSPETGRIECRWSLQEPPADDHLCASVGRTMRRLPPASRRSPLRRRPAIAGCHKPVSEPVIISAQAA
jgi:hypothetical protein